MQTTPSPAPAQPTVTFASTERHLLAPEDEATAHANMALGFDTHMRRRCDIDRHLAHLTVEAEGLYAAAEAFAAGKKASSDESSTGGDWRTARLHAQLQDEIVLLDAQVDAAKRLSASRRGEIDEVKALLRSRGGTARKHYGIADLPEILPELTAMEERIRTKEDERLELSKTVWQRAAAARQHLYELESEGTALRAQLSDLSQLKAELDRQVMSVAEAVDEYHTAAASSRKSPKSGAPPSAHLGMPPEIAGASDTEVMLRREIDLVNQSIGTIEEELHRDGALKADGSPRERFRESGGSDDMDQPLSSETLIRIMQLLKASLFNLNTDIATIEATVIEINKSRETHTDPQHWGQDLVGEALSSAARFAHRPYEADLAVAEKMVKKLRRLVLVCDTVDGLTADWVVDYATRRGIALEVSQFYEVAMVCRGVILDARRKRQLNKERHRAMQHSATKGKVFASLGMRRTPHGGRGGSQQTYRTPSQQQGYADSDDGEGGHHEEEEEEE
jgi:hypothetical protein